MATEDARSPRHERVRLATSIWSWLQRHPGFLPGAAAVVGGLASATAAIAGVVAGGIEVASGSAFWVAVAASLIAIAAQVFTSIRRSRSEKRVADERVDMQLAFNYALAPLLEDIAKVARMPVPQRSEGLATVILSACSTLKILFPAAEHARAVVYLLDEGKSRKTSVLRLERSHGRSDHPRAVIDRGDDRGRATLDWFWGDGPSFIVGDAAEAKIPGYDAAHARYRTFIRARIMAGRERVGIICVDAPLPGTLDDSDIPTVDVLALLLGVAITVTSPQA